MRHPTVLIVPGLLPLNLPLSRFLRRLLLSETLQILRWAVLDALCTLQPSVSKRSRQTNSASAARQTESSGAVRREVPIAAEEQAPIVTPPPVIEEVDQEAFEEVDQTLVDPRMSTQDYLEEAENILDHPSSQEVVVAATDLPQVLAALERMRQNQHISSMCCSSAFLCAWQGEFEFHSKHDV